MQFIGTASKCLAAILLLVCQAAPSLSSLATAQGRAQSADDSQGDAKCTVDLTRAGEMADIVSNALNRGLDQEAPEVGEFLKDAYLNYADGQALLTAVADHFKVDEAVLAREVEKYRHCNCTHPGGENATRLETDWDALKISKFASDVTLHVVLHEVGHALLREFDLPVLGNEETLADAFATHYLTTYLPERAVDVLSARTRSLMIEAGEVRREEWTVSGEHNCDARRAFQIAALAVAADPERYRPVAVAVGMSEDDIRSAADYGTEVHRSWRRTLAPLWMPKGMASNEARLAFDEDSLFGSKIRSSGIVEVLREAIRRFDWHSQVKIRFVEGEGGAGWNRSKRTITVHSEYVHRFVTQGQLVPAKGIDSGGTAACAVIRRGSARTQSSRSRIALRPQIERIRSQALIGTSTVEGYRTSQN